MSPKILRRRIESAPSGPIEIRALAAPLVAVAIGIFSSAFATAQDAVRREAPASSRIDPGLLAIVKELATRQQESALLFADFEHTRRPDERQRRFLDDALHDAPESFVNASRGRVLPYPYVLELPMHRQAQESFAKLREALPRLAPADLFPFLDDDFLLGPPCIDDRLSGTFGSASRTGLAPALCARYVIFAALRDAAFFGDDEAEAQKAREAFISHLILRGEEDEIRAFLVLGSLAPPFEQVWSRNGVNAFVPAGPLRENRAKVGFTPDHEAIVDSLREKLAHEVDAAANEGGADPFAEVSIPRVMGTMGSTKAGNAHRVRNPRGFLPDYAANLHDAISSELHPDRPLEPGGRLSLDEAVACWRRLASELSPDAFWAEALPHFQSLVLGKEPHALDARIDDLERLGTDLSADERRELDALRKRRSDELAALAALLPTLYAEHADLADAFDGLRSAESWLGRVEGSAARESLLANAWTAAAYRDGAFAAEHLERRLSGDLKAGLSPAASTAMIRSVAAFAAAVPGGPELLERVAREGSDEERMHALVNSNFFAADVASDLVARAAIDCAARMQAGADAFALRNGIFLALENRSRLAAADPAQGAAIASALVSTFDVGGANLWHDDLPVSAATPTGQSSWRWFANAIPQPDWDRLLAEGRISPRLAAFRGH